MSRRECKVKFTGSAFDRFERLRDKLGFSPGEEIEVIREALQVLDYLVDEHRANTKFFRQAMGQSEPKSLAFFSEETRKRVVCISDKSKERS